MSEMSQKRSRKSKLVPRMFKDADESSNLKIEPPEKQFKAYNESQNKPSTSSYQPLQFDIKVEVEECDENDCININSEMPDSLYKTEIVNENDMFEVEEQDINSMLTKALSGNKCLLPDSSDDEYELSYTQDKSDDQKMDSVQNMDPKYVQIVNKNQHIVSEKKKSSNAVVLKNDHDYGPKPTLKPARKRGKQINYNNKNTNTLPPLKVSADEILDALDDICTQELSSVDKILSIEMRNMWGRCRSEDLNQTIVEKKLQVVLNSWKYWKVSVRSGEVPLMYKCYICDKAWWHLDPFRDHLTTHTEDFRLESEPQQQSHHQTTYNLVAIPSKSYHTFRNIKVDGDCWRCGNNFDYHVANDNNECSHCLAKFYSCTKYRAHEAVCVKKLRDLVMTGSLIFFTCHLCPLKVREKEDLQKHYHDFHCVRSDLPLFIDVRNCVSCSRNYGSLPFHYCNKKKYSMICNYCLKKFPSKLALDIHNINTEIQNKCAFCNEVLPRKCMLVEHLLRHSNKFMMFQKCLACKDDILLYDDESMAKHQVIWHKQKLDKKQNHYELVLVPTDLILAQNIASYTDLCKSREVLTKCDVVMREEDEEIIETENLVIEDETGHVIQIDEDMDSKVTDDFTPSIDLTPTVDLPKPSTSRVKTQIEQELSESMVKQKMIEEMQKNVSFTGDEDGYEFILASVFNTSKSSSRTPKEDDIPTEGYDFDEIILELNEENQLRRKTPNCDFSTDDLRIIKQHKKSHNLNIVTCFKCKVEFTSLRGYLTHLSEHGYILWSCPDCRRTYSRYSSLAYHVKMKSYRLFTTTRYVAKTNGKPQWVVKLNCTKCGKMVSSDYVLDHWQSHLGDVEPLKEIAEESVVDVSGTSQEPEKESEVEHESEAITESMSPDVMDKVIDALVEKTKRNMKKKCVACGRSFERNNDCKRHHIEHLLDHAYKNRSIYKGLRCQICSSIFDKAGSYKYHMRNHGHLPIYKCQLCQKTFSDSSNYVKHQKTHSSTYICDICNRKYQAKTSLIKHMKFHATDERINCIYCHKYFYAESDFSRHLRSSHNQNLFKFTCIICKKKFKTTKEKWEHMWVVHKERKDKADCPICNIEFRRMTDVKQHIKNVHDMEISVMNVKIFKQLLHKMREGQPIDDHIQASSVKSEPDDQLYVCSESDKQGIYNSDQMISVIKKELDESDT